MISFITSKKDAFTLVQLDIKDGVCSPDEMANLNIPDVDATRGVILSGRAPVWLYGRLIHHYHPTAWIATFDPRLGGGVVVTSHVKGINTGDIIPLDNN